MFPPACAIAHRLPANPEAGRRSPVLQLFSDGRQKQCRSENNRACPVRCHSAWSRIRAAVSVLIVLRQPDRRPPAIRTGYKSRRAQDRFPTWKNNGYASVVQKRGGVIPTGTATNHGCDIDQVNSVPSNQPSRPLRSELTSKPAGLHLNDRLRLSHDRGPSKRSDTGIKECRSTPKGVGRYPPGGTGDASREAVDQMVVPKAA